MRPPVIPVAVSLDVYFLSEAAQWPVAASCESSACTWPSKPSSAGCAPPAAESETHAARSPNVTRAASQLRRGSRLPHGLPRWLPARWLPRMADIPFYDPRCVADVEEWRRSGARSAAGAAGAALCGGTRGSAAVVGALRAAAGSDDARGAVHCDDSGGAPAAQPAFPTGNAR